jgi:hypothetical protein
MCTYTMEESGGLSHEVIEQFMELHTRWSNVISFTARPLYQGIEHLLSVAVILSL